MEAVDFENNVRQVMAITAYHVAKPVAVDGDSLNAAEFNLEMIVPESNGLDVCMVKLNSEWKGFCCDNVNLCSIDRVKDADDEKQRSSESSNDTESTLTPTVVSFTCFSLFHALLLSN